MNILEEIVAWKKQEVAERKQKVPVRELEQAIYFSRENYSLRAFLLDPVGTGIIAEFKRKSPSKGIFNAVAKPEIIAGAYAHYGASGLSILTDEKYFAGSSDDLRAARAACNIPILRKDFMIDEYQVIEAKAMGADVILLIAACLTKEQVGQLAFFARSLGLEVLLEIHSGEELEKLSPAVTIVGVNNRNLATFKVDINRSIALAEQIPDEFVKIAESGISSPETILELRRAGFRGFLIGENFMKEKDPGEAFRLFVDWLIKLNQ